MTSLLPQPLNDLPAAINLIAEITGVRPADAKRRLGQEHRRLGANVEEALRAAQVRPFVFSEELARFYSATDAFVYETFTWNRYPAKQQMRRWILDFLHAHYPGAARVLAYGDGLGFDSAGYALAGHQVTYFEVGQRSVAFARRVFESNQVSVDVCTRPEELALDSYDVVVCLDVLEHVPDPPRLVGELAGYLKAGGHLIVHAPFWYLHPNVSTHLASNLKYSGEWRQLYGAAGLHALDACIAWNPVVLEKNSQAVKLPWASRLKLALSFLVLRFSRVWNGPLTAIVLALLGQQRRRLLRSSSYLWQD